MANEKKLEAGTGQAATRAAVTAGGAAVAPAPEISALQQTVEALRAELQAMKRASAAPQRIPVEGVFAAAPAPVPSPVQTVISQYEALERALQLPVPAWVFPGSSNSLSAGA